MHSNLTCLNVTTCQRGKNFSHTGTRTRVFRVLCIRKEVKAGYPNQLDYMGSYYSSFRWV